VRTTTVFLTTIRMPFTWKERFFIAIAWLPKGTLQVKRMFLLFSFSCTQKKQNNSGNYN